MKVLKPIVNSSSGKTNIPVYKIVAGYAILEIPPGNGPFKAEFNDQYAFDYHEDGLAYYAIDVKSPNEDQAIKELEFSVELIDEGLVGFQMEPTVGTPRTTWTEQDNVDNQHVYRTYMIHVGKRPVGQDLREITLHRRGKKFNPIEGSSGFDGMGRFEHGQQGTKRGFGTGRKLVLYLREAGAAEEGQTFEEYVTYRNSLSR